MVKFSGKQRGFLALAIVLLFSACASSANISEELSPAELIQRAQEASDRNRYKSALKYYEALLERNRENIDLIITAEYEIAFIHYKQKKYTQARGELNSLLDYYSTPDEELLPQQFKRLAQIVLGSIDKKENHWFLLLFKKKKKAPSEDETEYPAPSDNEAEDTSA